VEVWRSIKEDGMEAYLCADCHDKVEVVICAAEGDDG